MAAYCPPRSSIPTSDLLGLFSRALSLYISNISTIAKIALSFFIPALLTASLGALCLPGFSGVWSALWEEFKRNDDNNEPAPLEYGAEFFFFLIIYYLGYLLYCFAVAAIIKVANDTNAGNMGSTSFVTAIDSANQCVAPVFIAGCLIVDASLIGMLLFIVPGIYFAISWWLTFPIVVAEGLGIIAAMKRSWNISSGYRLDLLKIILLYLLAYLVLGFLFNLFLVLVKTPHFIRLVLGYTIPVVCIQPLVCVLQSVVYFDLKARNEAMSITTDPLLP